MKNARFSPLSVQYRVVIVLFYLWVVDWLTALMSNIISQLRIMMDFQHNVVKNSMPTKACSSAPEVECSGEGLETASSVVMVWVICSVIFGSLVQPFAWRAGGFRLSLASSFALKLLRALFSGLFYLLIKPFSPTYLVLTAVEVVTGIFLNGNWHNIVSARFKKVIGNVKTSVCRVRGIVHPDLREFEEKETHSDEQVEMELELLLRRMATGIHYIHGYTLSRLIMIVILLFSDTESLGNNLTAFVHEDAQNNTSRYLASYSFQLALNCIATRLVQETHRFHVQQFHRKHSELKKSVLKAVKSIKRMKSLHWHHLKLGDRNGDEHEENSEYGFDKSFAVQEITAHMTPAISSMTVFAVMHTLLAYNSAYEAISSGLVMNNTSIAQKKSLDSLQWLSAKTSFPTIGGFIYEGCICQVAHKTLNVDNQFNV